MNQELTAESVRAILEYEPSTGVFRWRARGNPAWNARYASKPAGYRDGHGYIKIMVCGKNQYAHRLAWLYVTGAWPTAEIDHIDGDRGNTKFANLRAATREQNSKNAGLRSNNTSGFKGVHWESGTRKWKAEIRQPGRKITLGRFNTPEAAHAAYCVAAERLHGAFARTA